MQSRIEVTLTSDDYRKYPFLPESLERVRKLGITLNDLAAPALKNVLEHASSYVRAAIDARELPPMIEDCDAEILTYMTTLIFLRIIFDKILIRRFSVLFSKRFNRLLLNEESEKIVFVLSRIGVRMKITNKPLFGYNLAINILDFIENIPESRGPWKLFHRVVDHGWVFVNKFEAARLGEEALKKYVEKRVEDLQLEGMKLPDEVFKLVETLSREWGVKLREIRDSWTPSDATGRESAYPPCIAAALENLRAGKNLPHSARFALASFLLNIGLSVEDVLETFRLAPDFNERIARYQVEHIAGMRGSGKRYTTYKCDNMRTLGLCVADCGVRHPLQYYWLTLRRKRGEREGG